MRIYIFVLLIIATFSVSARAVEYESIDAFKLAQKNFVVMDVISSEPDINGDGLRDWIGVFYNKTQIQIFVLLGLKDGRYTLSGASEPAEFGGYDIGDGWINEITAYSKNAFYLTFAVKSGYSGFSSYKHRFKLIRGGWRLVGQDYEYMPIGDEPGGYSVSINYLTGNFIKSIDGESKSITGKRTYPVYLLRDFDFYNPYGMDEFWK
jgi:hypothetical protein